MVGLDDTIDLAKKFKKRNGGGGGGGFHGSEPQPLPGIITPTPTGQLGGEKEKKRRGKKKK